MSGLADTTARLLADGRGLLAADEHLDRMARALGRDQVTLEDAAAHRRMLLTTPGLGEWISGAVVAADAVSHAAGMVGVDSTDGLVLGVRMGTETGLYPYSDPDRALARGHEIRTALAALRDDGVQFVKWRADLEPEPDRNAGYVDTVFLTIAAALTQDCGLVPVLDVAMPNQKAHSLAVATAVTANALHQLYDDLSSRGVDTSAVIVRMNLVRAGVWHEEQTTSEGVGSATMRVLRECIPGTAPGVLFMSTGQETVGACTDLAAVSRVAVAEGWTMPIGFAWGRALVSPATVAWVAGDGDVVAGQEALADACRAACTALRGSVPRPEPEFRGRRPRRRVSTAGGGG